MKRFIKTVILGISLSMFVPVIALAGWEKDNVGWWYKHKDGSYPKAGWEQIEGKYYYFDENGYMLHDSITPDGYVVGTDGAWIESIVPAKRSAAEKAESVNDFSNEKSNSEETSYSARPDVVTNIYHSPKKDDDDENNEDETKKKSSTNKKSSKSSYEKIYDKYKKKIEKSDGDVEELAELVNDGVMEMAKISVKNGLKDYSTYEKWAMKLEKVYEKKAGEKLLSSIDYSSFID